MSDTFILEYLFCCQFTTNNNIVDLLEDLATQRQKCAELNNKLKTYSDDYYRLYKDVLNHFKIKDKPMHIPVQRITNWSSIRKKALKDLILKNYIIEVKTKFSFDENTVKNLNRDLTVGLNFKNINDRNIIFNGRNDKISEIIGLNLAPNTYSWDYDIFAFE